MHDLRPHVVLEGIGRVVQRVGLAGGLQSLQGLSKAFLVVHATFEHVGGDAAVQERVVSLVVLHRLAHNEFTHDQLDEVLSAKAHVVGVAPAAGVHFEEAEAAVATVVLDVEVRETSIPDMRQEPLGARNDGLLAFTHDAQRVAERGGVVVLQAHHASCDHAHVAGGVRERGKRADGVVAAGDEVLQHQQVVVVRRADAAPNLRKVLG